ncbi:MAG: DJ-1 family glyoxalase III [Candidatus Omnitrophota bacterium]
MPKKVLVFLAEGFEEMEAVISVDLLRRAELDVVIASIEDKLLVKGSRNIYVQADILLDDYKEIPDCLVLPGGGFGAKNLAISDKVNALIKKCYKHGKLIAAICASPAVVLAKTGILEGKTITCYPGCETIVKGNIRIIEDSVVIEDNIITSRGPGTAFDFTLAIIKKLCGNNVAENVKEKALII